MISIGWEVSPDPFFALAALLQDFDGKNAGPKIQ